MKNFIIINLTIPGKNALSEMFQPLCIVTIHLELRGVPWLKEFCFRGPAAWEVFWAWIAPMVVKNPGFSYWSLKNCIYCNITNLGRVTWPDLVKWPEMNLGRNVRKVAERMADKVCKKTWRGFSTPTTPMRANVKWRSRLYQIRALNENVAWVPYERSFFFGSNGL